MTGVFSLQSELAALEAKHTALINAAKPYASLSSAFWRLPPEIMQMIFASCLPDTRGAVMHASEAPLLLGRVCSRWRKIVEGTPEMWSRVHVVPPAMRLAAPLATVPMQAHPATNGGGSLGDAVTEVTRSHNIRSFERKRDIVASWISRSGTCPLDLSFVWLWGEGDEELQLCGLLLDVFYGVCDRWRRVDWTVPVKVFEFTTMSRIPEGLLDMKPSAVKMLRHFGIVDNRSTFTEVGMIPWPECLGFLQSNEDDEVPLLSLSLTFFSGCVTLPTIRWEGLRELHLESSVGFFWFREDPHMWDTLERCVVLESLTLKFPLSSSGGGMGGNAAQDILGWDGSKEAQERTAKRRLVTLPMLERLCVDGDQSLAGVFHITRTMAGMRCPRLKGLEVFGRNTGVSPEGNVEEEDEDDEDGDEEDQHESTPSFDDSPHFAIDGGVWTSFNKSLADGDMLRMSGQVAESERYPPVLPLLSAEPVHGIFHLLYQSHHPPLERLALESVTLLNRELLTCLTLVSPTLRELVVRDYAWRAVSSNSRHRRRRRRQRSSVGDDNRSPGVQGSDDEPLSPEDCVLRALNARPRDLDSTSLTGATSRPLSSSSSNLCPKLTLFNSSLSAFASQGLFCKFVESRYPVPPEGVERLRLVRGTFTAKEEFAEDVGGGVQKRMGVLGRVRRGAMGRESESENQDADDDEEDEDEWVGGGDVQRVEADKESRVPPLDVDVTFHMPISDEIVVSAWTGIEGL